MPETDVEDHAKSSGSTSRALPDIVRYGAIAEHPVFEPSRQPWSAPKVVLLAAIMPAARPSPKGYILVGLVMSAGRHTALVRDPQGKTGLFSEGQKLDGWRIRRIDAAGMQLNAGSQQFELTMAKQGH